MGWGLIAHALDNMVASHISLNHGYAWASLGLAFHCDFLIVEWSIIDRGTAPNEVGLWRLWRDKSNLCTLLPLDVGLDLPFSIMLSIIGLLVLWQWLMSWELYSLITRERERERFHYRPLGPLAMVDELRVLLSHHLRETEREREREGGRERGRGARGEGWERERSTSSPHARTPMLPS